MEENDEEDTLYIFTEYLKENDEEKYYKIIDDENESTYDYLKGELLEDIEINDFSIKIKWID